jgi:hypothetical protein
MNAAFASWISIAGLLTSASAVPPDPPSGFLDPPPGTQDYIGAFPRHTWVFGKLLWQSHDPCTKDFCEAAYNADPLFLLVQKEKACCGGAGYSLTIVGRVKGCSNVSYYLVWSEEFRKARQADLLAFLGRHVAGIASAISSSCGEPLNGPVATEPLSGLWR